MIKVGTKIIRDPIEIELLNAKDFVALQDIQEDRPFEFVLPERIQKLENPQKTIYKSGFLFEVYRILFPELSKESIIQIIIERYHVFVASRQFHRNIKSYESEKYSIFVEQ